METPLTERTKAELVDKAYQFVKTCLAPRAPFGVHTIFFYHIEERMDKSTRVTYARVDFTYFYFVESKDYQVNIKNVTPVSYSEYLQFINENRNDTIVFGGK